MKKNIHKPAIFFQSRAIERIVKSKLQQRLKIVKKRMKPGGFKRG